MKIKWFAKALSPERIEPIPLPSEARLPDDIERSRLEEFSPTWRYIQSWAEAEVNRLREKNDSPRNDPAATTLLRGQLKALKALLDLPNAGRDNRPGN